MSTTARPIIGIPACVSGESHRPLHCVVEKYIEAVVAGADGLPWLIPAFGGRVDPVELVQRLDALLLPGSPSNVEPVHYDGEASQPGTLHDPRRDDTTLPLIRAAIDRGIPVLGICRGHQELNVALGGTLSQLVQELPGRFDHRAREDQPYDVQYAQRHKVRLTPGGLFHDLALSHDELMVNSLHEQAIERLADPLSIEAVAVDGTIEGVSIRSGASFVVGVQWHPEWRFHENAFGTALFRRFGEAARNKTLASSASFSRAAE